MAIENLNNRVQYVGNASTVTAYVVSFPFYAATDLVVTVTDEDVVDETLTNITDYAVTGGNGSTGSLTTTDAIPATSTVTIVRSLPLTQDTAFTGVGKFPSESVDRALDRLAMIVQQLQRQVDRAIRVPDTRAVLAKLDAAEADGLIGFDDDGSARIYNATDLLALLEIKGPLTVIVPDESVGPDQLDGAQAEGIREVTDSMARDLSDITVSPTLPAPISYSPTITNHGVVMSAAVPALLAPGGVLRMRDLHPDYPYEFVMYTTGDHSGATTGIRPWFANDLLGPWLPWTDSAVAAALTTYGITLPTSGHNGAAPIIDYPLEDNWGEFFDVVLYDGQIYLWGHAEDLADDAQSQFLAIGTDGINFTFQGVIQTNSLEETSGRGQHNGYQKWKVIAGGFQSDGPYHDSSPIAMSRYYSPDGLHAVGGGRVFYGRETSLFGIKNKVLQDGRHPIEIAGELWCLLNYADTHDPFGPGGQPRNDRVVLARLDAEGEIIGNPTFVTPVPTPGTYNELGYPLYMPSYYVLGSKLYAYIPVRDAAYEGGVTCFELDFTRRTSSSTRLLEVQSGYEALAGRYPLALSERGHLEWRTNFVGPTIPAGWTETTAGSGSVVYKTTADSRGGVHLLADGSSSNIAMLQMDQEFALEYFDELSIEVDAAQALDTVLEFGRFTIGFSNAAFTEGIGLAMRRWTDPVKTSRGMYYSSATSTFVYEDTDFSYFEDGRDVIPMRHKISYHRLKRTDQTGVVWEKYLIHSIDGDPISVMRLTDGVQVGLVVKPTIRSQFSQFRVNSVIVRAIPNSRYNDIAIPS